jgi:hypothetical protein
MEPSAGGGGGGGSGGSGSEASYGTKDDDDDGLRTLAQQLAQAEEELAGQQQLQALLQAQAAMQAANPGHEVVLSLVPEPPWHGDDSERGGVSFHNEGLGEQQCAFIRAVRDGDAERVAALAGAEGVCVHSGRLDNLGEAPMHIACSQNHTAVVQALLDAGADVDEKGEQPVRGSCCTAVAPLSRYRFLRC